MTDREKMLDLQEIAQLTGYVNPRSAYRRLWEKGHAPDGYVSHGAAPRAVYRKEVVREVFGHRMTEPSD